MDVFFKRIFQTSKELSLSSIAASLSFYTTLSIPPFIVLFFGIIHYLELPLLKVLNREVDHLLVGDVSIFVKMIMNKKNLLSHYQKYGDGVGIFIILFSAGLVFRELRRSFNLIFQIRNVQTRVLSTGQLVVRFIKRELFPYVAVLLFIMLLLVYLTSSSSIVSLIPFDYRPKWFLYQNVVAFLFFTFIFAVLFRYSPDQKTSWFQSFVGGIVTTLFCMLGTHFVGVYMAKHFVFNFFGIFGPLFLFLIWVYYSYFMILFGAIVCAAL